MQRKWPSRFNKCRGREQGGARDRIRREKSNGNQCGYQCVCVCVSDGGGGCSHLPFQLLALILYIALEESEYGCV